MIYDKSDNSVNIRNFLTELTELSMKYKVKIGTNSKTTFITNDDDLQGFYELENHHCFGFTNINFITRGG